MFTGLIEDIGTVKKAVRSGGSAFLEIVSDTVARGLQVGDSVAVNGVCLTAVSFSGRSFKADVSPETLGVTNLGTLKSGSKVNLERALRMGDRLGGHMVSGHVDCVGKIKSVTRDVNGWRISVSVSGESALYVVERGSIAVDGTSLTVADVSGSAVELYIIPHTGVNTSLVSKKPDDPVNIEYDVIAKYILKQEHINQNRKREKGPVIDIEYLNRNGFI